ncbi:MAG: 5-formyltetrahydrofolate cyclo-ligase, partial [Oscillospiraceae bacterium]|nr:5-formyltetrahydrofolate cyclo-ligase [Oscillospiraceae bacterium]
QGAAGRQTAAALLALARTVLSYCAAPDEADLAALHAALAERGTRVCFPVVTGPGTMEARVPESPEALVSGAFGLRQPDPARSAFVAPETIDLALCPCVGFDRAHRRLGHGGGYYDRYLAACPRARRVLVGFACQELDAVACEPHDLPMQRVVCETFCE